MALRFTWDPAKAAANLRTHGVGFPEAATAFADPWSATVPDPDHSASEARFILVSLSARRRLLVVAHTERGDTLRLISARLATRLERHRYEEDH
jgi:uncharacterized DUF497 family protein